MQTTNSSGTARNAMGNVWLASMVEAAGYCVECTPTGEFMQVTIQKDSGKRFIRFGLWGDWVAAYTHIINLPNAGPGRADVLALALRLNDVSGMGKYILNDDWISLDVHYPAAHMTPQKMSRLIATLHEIADLHAAKFREAEQASSSLDVLERALKK